MKKQIYDEKNGLSYTLHGDYYLPDLEINEEEPTYGKYGIMRKQFLKEHRSARYQYLVLTGKLTEQLNQVDKEAREKVEMLMEQMVEQWGVTEELKMMNSKEFFKTSQPSPQEFLDVFEEVKKKQETLICLSLSSKLSGTYQSACLAKDMVDYENIYIVDTLTAVAGIRLLCEVAINWIDENRSVENIVSGLEELKEHVHIYAGLDTLEYLAKGGRISKTAAAIGTLASIKPIICVEHGEVVVAGKTRGVNKATSVVCEKMQSDIVDTLYPVYTLYSYGLENVEKLESKLDLDVNRVRIGSTIGVHIGPNAFGVCFVSKL